jgi:hypothetical protein
MTANELSSELIGAKAMSDWQTMRVDGETLEKLARESK